MPFSENSKIFALGYAKRIGECVAIKNCESSFSSSWIMHKIDIIDVGERAASGSSSR